MIRIYDTGDIVPAGSDDSATGDATVGPVNGKVLGVYLEFDADCDPNTDTVVATVHAPIKTILTVDNSATDAWYYPRAAVHDVAGAAATFDGTRAIVEPIAVRDYIKVSVHDADITHPIRAYIVVEE